MKLTELEGIQAMSAAHAAGVPIEARTEVSSDGTVSVVLATSVPVRVIRDGDKIIVLERP